MPAQLAFRTGRTAIATSPTISSNVGAGVLFAPTSQGLFFPPLNTKLSYSSRLQDVEINACRSLNDCVSVLAGVRYRR
jgi:hypothetical protein